MYRTPLPTAGAAATIGTGCEEQTPGVFQTRSTMAITKAEPGKTRVGWIGTGVMGRWMCQHLATKGYAATVYNRSKDKAQPLLDLGAKWAAAPKQVAESADVVFAIVGFPKDVREVFL